MPRSLAQSCLLCGSGFHRFHSALGMTDTFSSPQTGVWGNDNRWIARRPHGKWVAEKGAKLIAVKVEMLKLFVRGFCHNRPVKQTTLFFGESNSRKQVVERIIVEACPPWPSVGNDLVPPAGMVHFLSSFPSGPEACRFIGSRLRFC